MSRRVGFRAGLEFPAPEPPDKSMKAQSFAHFREEVYSLYRATRAPKTAQKIRQVLDAFGQLPAVETTADLTPANVAALAESWSGKHPNTRATLLSSLRRACTYASRSGYLDTSPFAAWPG